MKVDLLFPWSNGFAWSMMQFIEDIARESTGSKSSGDAGDTMVFLSKLLRNGHWSVFEHVVATIRFSEVTRGMTHELVRHRLGAYTQRSTRYRIDDDPVVVHVPGASHEVEKELSYIATRLQREYKDLPKDVRRHLLPIGVETSIVATHNLRSWHHIFEVRLSAHAHEEIREAMFGALMLLREIFSPVFDDLVVVSDARHIVEPNGNYPSA